MARLPDATSLGRRQSLPQSGPSRLPERRLAGAPRVTPTVGNYRAVASGFDRSADIFGASMRDEGSGLIAVGRSLERTVARMDEAEKDAARREYADADAAWQVGLLELDSKYSDDQDHASLVSRYRDEALALRDAIGANLGDVARTIFDRRSQVDGARGVAAMSKRAAALGRDQTVAWLNGSLTDIRRAYLEAPDAEGRMGAVRGAEAVIGAALERGAIDHNEAQRLKTEFVSAAALGRIQMLDDRAAVAALSDENSFARAIDPAQRAVLLRQRQARLDAAMGGEVRDAVAVLEAGKLPAGLGALQQAVRGTKYAESLEQAVRHRTAAEEFISLPVRDQAARLKRFSDATTATRSDVALHTRLARIHARIVTGATQGHGLALAAEAGIIAGISSLSPDDPTSAPLRATQARMASEWLGMPVSPLTPAEADGLAAELKDAPADAVTSRLMSLHDGFGRDGALAVVGQVVPKHPALAAALILAPDRPLIAQEIVAGSRLVGDHKALLPTRADRLSAIEEAYGDTFEAAPGALAAYLAAADALYLGRTVGTGDVSYDSDAFEIALDDAAGGVAEYNGHRILVPVPGMGEEDVEDAMRGITDENLVTFGNGQPVLPDDTKFSVSMFKGGLFRNGAQLVTSGVGRYLIRLGELGYVQTEDGEPYEFDLRAALQGAL